MDSLILKINAKTYSFLYHDMIAEKKKKKRGKCKRSTPKKMVAKF